ncbi:MAG: FAD:protein FMN transferase [Eubacteriales bacterium]|nr:FAD:protein FMN transferase [Eubacteriales bacterium]
MSKKIYGGLLLGMILFCCFVCNLQSGARGQQKYDSTLLYFDTVVQISFYAGEDGENIMQHCREICDEIENTFSRTRETSELYRINHRTENTVQVSDGIAELVEMGLRFYEISGGKLDITIAPLSDVWDFKSEDATIPLREEIEEAVEKVDASRVHLDGNTLSFDRDDTMLDLGALAKGYAADRLREYLNTQGVTSGIINLGGNVLTLGTKPDGSAWRIGIQKPFDERGDTITVVEADNESVVTSGIYERYFEQDGVIYHHILDPDTGYPIENDIWGVTILSSSSLLGDALSTTCLTLGVDAARELIDSMEDVEAIFVKDDLKLIYTEKK